jgi:chromate transporter
VVATLGLLAPTALLMFAVAHTWTRYKGARWQLALERGLRPIAAGMILAAGWVLLRTLDGGWAARTIAVLSATLLLNTRVNPLLLMLCGALLLLGASELTHVFNGHL